MIKAFEYRFFTNKKEFDLNTEYNEFRRTYVIENVCEFEEYPAMFPVAFKRLLGSSYPRYYIVDFMKAYTDVIKKFNDTVMEIEAVKSELKTMLVQCNKNRFWRSNMSSVFSNDFIFIDEERNVSESLSLAVNLTKSGITVDVTFKNHQLGKLKFLGEVETADDMKDGSFAEVYFVKDEKCYYINTPTDEELESLPVSNVTRVGNNVLIA